ncbi:MAG TPA: hypothetical protein PLB62_15775 [Candidatus Sumerlaeota bacterium]|nr:hypothetical protein [Candidatus Sumerlaeota bacterium]
MILENHTDSGEIISNYHEKYTREIPADTWCIIGCLLVILYDCAE